MSARRRNFLWYLFLALVLISAGIGVLLYEIYYPHTAFSHGARKIVIIPGLGSRKIGTLLKREGFIESKWVFVAYVSLRGEASDLKPGTYTFPNGITIPEMTRDLVRGAREQTITIPEGWTAEEIGVYLEEQDVVSARDFQAGITAEKARSFEQYFPFLKDTPKSAGLEGYLFPDTYRILSGTSVEQIVLRLLENLNEKLTPDLIREVKSQQRSLFGIITLASLLEKEVVSDKDRALVSGILLKRIKLDIPLQVDATIIYSRNREIGNRNQRGYKISLEDTKIDSPYNTYQYKGLPIGPIANPGLSAIRAAIFPEQSPYLYYLSAPDGRTIFSRTLEEHNRAKEKYLK